MLLAAMAVNSINLPLYRVLRQLNVPEHEAEAAAQAGATDLSHLATKEELRAEIATLRSELKTDIAGIRTEIAQAIQRQTIWMVTVIFATAGLIVAAQRLAPAPARAEPPLPSLSSQAPR